MRKVGSSHVQQLISRLIGQITGHIGPRIAPFTLVLDRWIKTTIDGAKCSSGCEHAAIAWTVKQRILTIGQERGSRIGVRVVSRHGPSTCRPGAGKELNADGIAQPGSAALKRRRSKRSSHVMKRSPRASRATALIHRAKLQVFTATRRGATRGRVRRERQRTTAHGHTYELVRLVA